MIVRNITKQDKLETMKISSVCFNYPFSTDNLSEEEFLETLLSSPKEKLHKNWDCQLVVYDDNNDFMACMAAIPFDFYFDGSTYRGNGIGNVCTYPHHRKKGAIRVMFEKMLLDSYRNGQVFSYLYPFSEAFYGKYGYHRLSNSKHYEFRLLGFPEVKYDGNFCLLTEENIALLEEFKLAYNQFAKNYNMMIKRVDFDWTNVTDAKAHQNNNYAYLYKDKSGVPRGYLVFKRDGRSLRCRELVFDNFETLRILFTFIKSYATDNDTFCCHVPSLIHMEHFCTDFSTFPTEIKNVSNGMVRVLNVQTVLENAAYIGDGSLLLKISDKWISENNGVFSISYKDGNAKQVSFTPAENVSEGNCDIEMSISVFSAAIVGNYDINDFDYMEDIKIYCEKSKARQIFYKKNCFINNYF